MPTRTALFLCSNSLTHYNHLSLFVRFVLEYRSSLRLHLAQYNDPGYEDTMMEFFQWDQLLGIVSSDVDAIVKVCQWKDRSCLQSSTGGRWVALYTRVGQCWELDVPDREVWLTSQTMRLVFGKFQLSNPRWIPGHEDRFCIYQTFFRGR